jgi:mitochondrial inner membrane protein COX18
MYTKVGMDRWWDGAWPARQRGTLACAEASCRAGVRRMHDTKVQHQDNYHDMLSSKLLRRPARQLLLPHPAASSAPRGCPPLRTFHASAPRHDPLLDAVLYLPHEFMNIIHTSVPWYAALPLTAFTLRALLVTTAGAWSRSLTARYIGLHPLRQALAFRKRNEILQTGRFRSPKEAMVLVKKGVNNEVAKLDDRWNVTLAGQIGWTFAQIPIFFALAETVRQKCGAREGLLGMSFSAFGSDDAQTTVGDMAVTTSTWFEPSLANEGMLWFQDLLLPDPTGVLPFIVSGLMFTNIYMTKNTVENDSPWPRYIRKGLLGISLLVGPFCQNLPAALMVYWGSSTASVMLWNFWLDWRYPAPRGFTACRRPLVNLPKPALKARKG